LNEDELRKLGWRVRPRRSAAGDHRPGRITFDERGNAIYTWNDELLDEDSAEGECARRHALAHPGLAIVEDDPDPNGPIRHNPNGLRFGYNPYESGLLVKKERRPKRDLRALSKWIEMKRRLSQQPPDED